MDYKLMRLMQSIGDRLDEGYNDPPIQVVCPVCGHNGIHGGESDDYQSGKTTWHLTWYLCECGHSWIEYVYEHKGDVCKGKIVISEDRSRAKTIDYFADLHKGLV